mgnify:CR=1 FL=1
MSKELVIPRPPKGATHARIDTPSNQNATVAVKDFDTLEGTAGTVTWLGPETSRTRALSPVGDQFEWNGYQALDELGNPVTVVSARPRGRPKKKRSWVGANHNKVPSAVL